MHEAGEITNLQIGAALYKARKSKKLTQKKVAEDMHTSQSFISSIEKGKKTAKTEFIIKLIKYYGVNYESIFGKIKSTPEKTESDSIIKLLLKGTNTEDAADVYFELCEYLLVRTLYGLNPHNKESIFNIPKDEAISVALKRITQEPENMTSYLNLSKTKCKKLEIPIEYNDKLIDFINRCEKLLGKNES